MNKEQGIKIKITFIDGSEAIYVSSSTQLKFALADFEAKSKVQIDGKFFNTDYIFYYEVVVDA